MFKYLFGLNGPERYDEIKNLTVFDRDAIHIYYRRCDRCPLGLKYVDSLGIPRTICTDVAKSNVILDVLRNGGTFVSEK